MAARAEDRFRGEADALALLAGNGRLVKRPFALGEGFGLAGFDAAEWTRAFGG
jgi:arsenate reductase